MNDRCVLQAVNSPKGPSRTAATATRGSSRTQTGLLDPGNHMGTDARSAGNRTTRQETTG